MTFYVYLPVSMPINNTYTYSLIFMMQSEYVRWTFPKEIQFRYKCHFSVLIYKFKSIAELNLSCEVECKRVLAFKSKISKHIQRIREPNVLIILWFL